MNAIKLVQRLRYVFYAVLASQGNGKRGLEVRISFECDLCYFFGRLGSSFQDIEFRKTIEATDLECGYHLGEEFCMLFEGMRLILDSDMLGMLSEGLRVF